MWFLVNGSSGYIGRITPNGRITEWPVPRFYFTDIAAGSDGNLWFTGSRGSENEVGRITPRGRITLFVLDDNSPVVSIAHGADGNMYFVDQPAGQYGFGPGHLGQITPQGRIHLFNSLSANAIAPGLQGSLWLATQSTVTRISPTLSLRSYFLPRGKHRGPTGTNPDAFSVILGPDGNEWFDEGVLGAYSAVANPGIGFVNSRGALYEQPLDPGTAGGKAIPLSIATGPDGNVWFTQTTANGLARVNLGLPKPAPLRAVVGRRASVASGVASLHISCDARAGLFCEGTATLSFADRSPSARSARFFIAGDQWQTVSIPVGRRVVSIVGRGSVLAGVTLQLRAYGDSRTSHQTVRLTKKSYAQSSHRGGASTFHCTRRGPLFRNPGLTIQLRMSGSCLP
jgi:streptogramin lyase